MDLHMCSGNGGLPEPVSVVGGGATGSLRVPSELSREAERQSLRV